MKMIFKRALQCILVTSLLGATLAHTSSGQTKRLRVLHDTDDPIYDGHLHVDDLDELQDYYYIHYVEDSHELSMSLPIDPHPPAPWTKGKGYTKGYKGKGSKGKGSKGMKSMKSSKKKGMSHKKKGKSYHDEHGYWYYYEHNPSKGIPMSVPPAKGKGKSSGGYWYEHEHEHDGYHEHYEWEYYEQFHKGKGSKGMSMKSHKGKGYSSKGKGYSSKGKGYTSKGKGMPHQLLPTVSPTLEPTSSPTLPGKCINQSDLQIDHYTQSISSVNSTYCRTD